MVSYSCKYAYQAYQLGELSIKYPILSLADPREPRKLYVSNAVSEDNLERGLLPYFDWQN